MASTSSPRRRSRRPGGSAGSADRGRVAKILLFIVGGVAGCLFMYAVANRPEMTELKASIETSLADWRRTHPRAPVADTHVDDWFIAAAYTAKLEGAGTFRCIGAVKVSICTSPDDRK